MITTIKCSVVLLEFQHVGDVPQVGSTVDEEERLHLRQRYCSNVVIAALAYHYHAAKNIEIFKNARQPSF